NGVSERVRPGDEVRPGGHAAREEEKERRSVGSARLFRKLQFVCRRDKAALTAAAQKFPDCRSTDLAVIARKVVHIHADELAGERRVHIARIRERMTHRTRA